jgi:hypothetical protein
MIRASFSATMWSLMTSGVASVPVNISPGWLLPLLSVSTSRTVTVVRVWAATAPTDSRGRAANPKIGLPRFSSWPHNPFNAHIMLTTNSAATDDLRSVNSPRFRSD